MNEQNSHTFRIYNTLSQQVEEFVPNKPGSIDLYVCGLTVYDRVHVGHARAMVIFDAFVRYLRLRGWRVNYVRNFTDIDDKIIRRANELKISPAELADENIRLFREDVSTLGLSPPDNEPRATQAIGDIHSLITKLLERGHAYVAEGTVWFSVASAPAYGKLSRQQVDNLRSDDAPLGKRHPADFALWKAAEPSEPFWPSPWGPGRPGWHIECSAMSCPHPESRLDIHGGGLDLVFPHHENEIVQSECATGHIYSPYWMHNGLLTVASGQKMGKSLGNVTNICDILAEYPAEVVRFYYLQNKYRSPLLWGEGALDQAFGLVIRLYSAKELAEKHLARGVEEVTPEAGEVLILASTFNKRFLAALDDDFNTAAALAVVFELTRSFNRYDKFRRPSVQIGRAVLSAYELVFFSLNLLGQDVASFNAELTERLLAKANLERKTVEDMLAIRGKARAAGNWHESDRVRDELAAIGVELSDSREGTKWRLRPVSAIPEI